MKYPIISLIGLFAVCMTASAEEPFLCAIRYTLDEPGHFSLHRVKLFPHHSVLLLRPAFPGGRSA